VSVIVGVTGEGTGANSEMLVGGFLAEQRAYGSAQSFVLSSDRACFGGSPSGGRTSALASLGPLLLAADIQLHNRAEIHARAGVTRPGASDADLLIAAWLKAGEECLAWIAGDFALAVYDSRTQTLALARDPAGQMPLHYAQAEDALAFASMPSGLRPFVRKLQIDRSALAGSLCGIRDDDPRSHFDRISRLLPGELVRLETNRVRRKVYWTPSTACVDPLPGQDLVEEFRYVLDVAVADRLKGCARPLATHLSSGYDSSAVTATAARLLAAPEQVVAFTSAPAKAAPIPPDMWRIADESEIAAATAARFGIRHVVVREMPSMRTVVRRQSLLVQEPIIGVPNMAWLLQIRREAATMGANCLLSGENGNLTLNAGGLPVLSEWIRRWRWLTWIEQARHAAARPDTHWRGVLYNSFRPWLPQFVQGVLHRRRFGAKPAHDASFLRTEWHASAVSCAHSPRSPRNSYAERIQLIRSGNPGMFRKAGLAGEGIDERDPLSDRRLIEFSLRIPPELLYWNGFSRPLARVALADRLPSSVIDLKVRGLQAADWPMRFTQADAYEMLEEISVNATAQEILDLQRMRQAIDRWPAEDWNRLSVLGEYRLSLIGALATGMFALVHEQGARASEEAL
jgi:asparagine synthase (glutamine-hydrolysing)